MINTSVNLGDKVDALSFAELEFASEFEHVDIIPDTRLPEIRLISGTFGPFKPARRTKVPLWLAQQLYRSGHCRIVIPDWLSLSELQKTLERERSETNLFVSLPDHFLEHSLLIIEACPNDIPNVSLVRKTLQELREARQAKMMHGLGTMDGRSMMMTGLTRVEIAEVKPVLITCMDWLADLRRKAGPSHQHKKYEDYDEEE